MGHRTMEMCCGWTNQYARLLFVINGCIVLWAKDEKAKSDCYLQQVQKPGSVMYWVGTEFKPKKNLIPWYPLCKNVFQVL